MKKGMIASAVLGMVRTNCYFLINRETDEALIIDPADDAAAVRDWFLNNQKKPAAILLTHGHFDHILAAEELRKRFDIKIYAGDGEQELLENASWNLSASWSSQVVLHADEFVKDGEILSLAGFQIRVIATPGHTAGGVSYYLPGGTDFVQRRYSVCRFLRAGGFSDIVHVTDGPFGPGQASGSPGGYGGLSGAWRGNNHWPGKAV